jgi:ubiquitin-activating enzyme E1
MTDSTTEVKTNEDENNEFDENEASHKMDLQSRTAAALGVETMKNLASLTVLIIGLRGVGVETAKNLILTGPKQVTLMDDNACLIADVGSNFFLTEAHVAQGVSRSAACVKALAELNPYCTVDAHTGAMSDDFIQSFGAVVVTVMLPKNDLIRINELCRCRQDANGDPLPSAFILAVTQGVTAHMFTDFGPGHVVTDADGEPSRAFVVQVCEGNKVTIAAKRHGFDDGDEILFEDIEAETPATEEEVSLCELNGLAGVRVKRIYYKYHYKRSDGKIEKRTRQRFNQFTIDVSQTKFAGRTFTAWKNGGLVNEVKAKRVLNFRSLADTLPAPCYGDPNYGLSAFFGPQHPDQGAWEGGAGKTLHLLLNTALQFHEEKGNFPQLHCEDDSRAFGALYRKMNDEHKESGVDGVITADSVDSRRVNAYSWFFAAELTGYCAFLGGVAAQEVVKKFGKYTPIFQWLHSDHAQFIGGQIPSDAIPQNCRYDHQISIFGKAFQYKISNQKIFLVGTGALGCEYMKGLALMGVGTGPSGKVWCTDMDRIEISNLSRQFLFRARHVGQPKSTTAAASAREMNPAFNVEALEMKVWPETEDYFTDEFWDRLDLCWNALDNVQARKYTDNKCLLHGKPLLESGTMGTKCNSEVIIPYKTKSYNDGEEQEVEGIPMCTLQNFPYLPIHCIEWARSSFGNFEQDPKTYNAFFEDHTKYFEQVHTAEGEEQHAILRAVTKLVKIQVGGMTFAKCIALAFDEFVTQHVTRIKDLIHTFPEDEMVKDKYTQEVVGRFWTGNKKFPVVPEFDLSNPAVADYLYTSANLWAFTFGLDYVRDRQLFIGAARAAKLALPEWAPSKKISIKLEEEEEEVNDEDAKEEPDEERELEVRQMIEFLRQLDASQLCALKPHDFEKDDDRNFHIGYITSCANTRARNYRIKETSRHKCKIIAGKIIAALATTTAMICGLVELEFYKLKLGLGYINEDAFYNANINLGVASFQYFQPDSAIRNERVERVDPATREKEVAVPYPPNFTSWDTIVVDHGNLTIKEFVELFPKLFFGVAVDLLHKTGKMEKGQLLYSSSAVRRNTRMQDTILARTTLTQNMRQRFEAELVAINAYNDSVSSLIDARAKALVAYYVELYGELVSKERSYVLLTGSFTDPDGNIAIMPRIKFIFK